MVPGFQKKIFLCVFNSFLLKGASAKQVKFKQAAGLQSVCFIKALIHIAILFYKVLFTIPGGLISAPKSANIGL